MAIGKDRELAPMEFEALLASVVDAVLAIDDRQRIVFWNPSAAALFGCDASEACGKELGRFLDGHSKALERVALRAAQAGRPREIAELWGLRAGGEKFPIEAAIGKFEVDGRAGFSFVLRDVTVRKDVESRLHGSRRMLSTLIGNLPGMAYRCSNDGSREMQFVSAGCLALTGCRSEELLSGNIAFHDLIHPDDRQKVQRAIDATTGSQVEYRLSYRICTKLGDVRWVSDQGIVVHDENGDGLYLEGILTDVTELKQAEEGLRSSEQKFRQLATNAAVGIFQTDEQGGVEFVNPYWCEFAGLSQVEAHGSGWVRAIHPQDRELVARDWAERTHSAADYIQLSETRFLRPDGSVRWVEGMAVALKDSSGKVTGHLGAVTDLTERRRAEQITRGRNEALERLATGAPLDVVLSVLVRSADENLPHLRCSILLLEHATNRLRHASSMRLPEFYLRAIDGLEIGAGVGSCGAAAYLKQRVVIDDVSTHANWIDFRELAARADIRACWSEPILGASGEILGTLAMYDSQPRTPEAQELEFIETTAHLAGVAIERHRTYELLQESERRFRAVFNQRVELAKFLTPEGILTDANERCFKLLRARRSEVLGQPLWTAPWWSHDPVQQARLQQAIARAAAGEAARFDAEHRALDGRLATIDFSLTPILDEGGTVRMLFAEGLDITDARLAEKKLKETERRAHQAEKLASIATLTTGIAHDIGAPMTAILGYAEMMRDSLTDLKNRRRAGIIVEQLHRITELIQALLDMARPQERTAITIDLANLIERSIDFYRELMRTRKIAIELDLEPATFVSGDPNRLQQALLNLFVNAVDAMPEGGTLRVVLKNRDGRVEIEIQDFGVGIPPEALEQIFEPFFTTKDRGQGTGLGLSVAKSIVDEHLGAIAVESGPDRGTTFRIVFPTVSKDQQSKGLNRSSSTDATAQVSGDLAG